MHLIYGECGKLPKLNSRQWKYLFIGIVIFDLAVIGPALYIFAQLNTVPAESLAAAEATPTSTATATPTPWPGPGPRPTATATLPPTAMATTVLAESGFPPGFTPTPRPTSPPVQISLPQVFFAGRKYVDAPVVNQIYYPEPFFPAGQNNACGPVALYAAMQALNVDVNYSRLRDVAVGYGFNAEGISKSGLIHTALTLNAEFGQPLKVEYGDHYRTRDLIKHLRQGAVIAVLVWVRRENGEYRVVGDRNGIAHFLLVDRISTRSKKVTVAGSTLGMTSVPIRDFIHSWTGSPPNLPSTTGWRNYLTNEKPTGWALILKRS